MNSSFSIDLNEDQNHNLNHLFSSCKTTEDNYASSSISYPIFNDFPFYHSSQLLQPLHHIPDEGEAIYASHGEVLDHQSAETESHNKNSFCKKLQDRENSCSSSLKWMPSKMRLMKKMMKSDQTVSKQTSKFEEHKSSMEFDDNTAKNLPIRVCSDCNTTKTPLWRSGPRGPKSLCNACGIRQRKARRAAQESGNGATNSSAMKSKVQNKDSHLPFKKRCKFTAQARGRPNNKKKLCFEDLTSIILSKNNSAFHQVFPQDEKEAAILLMALSYGLVQG